MAAEAASSLPVLQRDRKKVDRKIASLVERLALLLPNAARLIGEELEKLDEAREAVLLREREAERMTEKADRFLVALSRPSRLLVPTANGMKRTGIFTRAVGVFGQLEDCSPEGLRERLREILRQVVVERNGTARLWWRALTSPWWTASCSRLGPKKKCAEYGRPGPGHEGIYLQVPKFPRIPFAGELMVA